MKVVERVAERLARGVRGWMAVGSVVVFGLFTALVLPAQARDYAALSGAASVALAQVTADPSAWLDR